MSAGIFVGLFLPSASAGPFTVAGTSGDGIMTLILGAVIGLLTWTRQGRGLTLGFLVVAGLISGYDLANIGRVASNGGLLSVQVGGGLILTVLCVAAGSAGWISSRSAASSG